MIATTVQISFISFLIPNVAPESTRDFDFGVVPMHWRPTPVAYVAVPTHVKFTGARVKKNVES